MTDPVSERAVLDPACPIGLEAHHGLCSAGTCILCVTARLVDTQAKLAAAEAALRQARNRIEYLGIVHMDHQHYEANEKTFLPEIDKVLDPQEPRHD